MYTLYFSEHDLKKAAHFPAAAHINEAFNRDPSEFLRDLIQGVGHGYNYSCSSFWDELDDYDKSRITHFNGVCIETEAGEEIVLSYQELYFYLDAACKRYYEKNPDTAAEMNGLLSQYAAKYLHSQ